MSKVDRPANDAEKKQYGDKENERKVGAELYKRQRKRRMLIFIDCTVVCIRQAFKMNRGGTGDCSVAHINIRMDAKADPLGEQKRKRDDE